MYIYVDVYIYIYSWFRVEGSPRGRTRAWRTRLGRALAQGAAPVRGVQRVTIYLSTIYLSIYLSISIYIYIYSYLCIYLSICVYTYIYIYIHTSMHETSFRRPASKLISPGDFHRVPRSLNCNYWKSSDLIPPESCRPRILLLESLHPENWIRLIPRGETFFKQRPGVFSWKGDAWWEELRWCENLFNWKH